MTGSRINARVIVCCQNYKIGTTPGIGMGGKTPIATAIIDVVCAITKIPVVKIRPQSSIESSRTTCRGRLEGKINLERGYYNHIATGRGKDPTSVRSGQDNSIGPSRREHVSRCPPSR